MQFVGRFSKIQQRQSKKHGFTLLELLMVISIIAFLVAISFAAFANFVFTSKEKATSATISKINKILQQRKEAFDRLNFKNEARNLLLKQNTSSSTLPAIPDVQTAEVIVRKQRFMLAFPQRVEERSVFNNVDYKSNFTALSPRPDFESSALLYLAITQGETFGAPQVDDDAFSANEVKIVPSSMLGVEVKYFVDAWGNPLRFYRCPTSLFKPQVDGTDNKIVVIQAPVRTFAKLLIPSIPNFDTTSPTANGPDGVPGSGNAGQVVGWPGSDDPEVLNRDPDDPTWRYFLFLSAMSPTTQALFRTKSRLCFAEATYHTPLVVSAGPDRKVGLFEPNDVTNMSSGDVSNMNSLARPRDVLTTDLLDNITNLNQRNSGN